MNKVICNISYGGKCIKLGKIKVIGKVGTQPMDSEFRLLYSHWEQPYEFSDILEKRPEGCEKLPCVFSQMRK